MTNNINLYTLKLKLQFKTIQVTKHYIKSTYIAGRQSISNITQFKLMLGLILE